MTMALWNGPARATRRERPFAVAMAVATSVDWEAIRRRREMGPAGRDRARGGERCRFVRHAPQVILARSHRMVFGYAAIERVIEDVWQRDEVMGESISRPDRERRSRR